MSSIDNCSVADFSSSNDRFESIFESRQTAEELVSISDSDKRWVKKLFTRDLTLELEAGEGIYTLNPFRVSITPNYIIAFMKDEDSKDGNVEFEIEVFKKDRLWNLKAGKWKMIRNE